MTLTEIILREVEMTKKAPYYSQALFTDKKDFFYKPDMPEVTPTAELIDEYKEFALDRIKTELVHADMLNLVISELTAQGKLEEFSHNAFPEKINQQYPNLKDIPYAFFFENIDTKKAEPYLLSISDEKAQPVIELVEKAMVSPETFAKKEKQTNNRRVAYTDMARKRFAEDEETLKLLDYIDEKVLYADDLGAHLESNNHIYQAVGSAHAKLAISKEAIRTGSSTQKFCEHFIKGEDYNILSSESVAVAGWQHMADFTPECKQLMGDLLEDYSTRPLSEERIAQQKEMIQLLKDSGLYEYDPDFVPEQGAKIYGHKKYFDKREQLTKALENGTAEEIKERAEELLAAEKTLETTYKRLDEISDYPLEFLSGNINPSREKNFPLHLRMQDHPAVLLNQTYYLMQACERFGLDVNEVAENPKILIDVAVNSGKMFNSKAAFPDCNSDLEVMLGISNFEIYKATDSTAIGLFMRSVDAAGYTYANPVDKGATAEVFAKLTSGVGKVAEYYRDSFSKKAEILSKLLLNDGSIKSANSVCKYASINPFTLEHGEENPTIDRLFAQATTGAGTAAINKSYELMDAYREKTAGNPRRSSTAFTLEDMVTATVSITAKQVERLKLLGNSSDKKEIAALEAYLKDPLLATRKHLQKIATKSTSAALEKEYRTLSNSKAKIFETIRTERNKANVEYSTKKLTLDSIVNDEIEARKEHAEFNKQMDKLRKPIIKLEATLKKAVAANKPAAIAKCKEALALGDKKVIALQEQALDKLEKSYLEGKIPERYLLDRSTQIISLDTSSSARFFAEKESYTGLRLSDLGVSGKPAAQQKEAIAAYIKLHTAAETEFIQKRKEAIMGRSLKSNEKLPPSYHDVAVFGGRIRNETVTPIKDLTEAALAHKNVAAKVPTVKEAEVTESRKKADITVSKPQKKTEAPTQKAPEAAPTKTTTK